MYKGNSVEIILPAYNESQTIKDYIKDLEKLKIFDKITAIDNNSSDNTKEEIEKTSAKYLFEKNQGFGAAVKRGLDNISCDYVVISEPDGSFSAKDVYLLLEQIENYDAVFTTRTHSDMKFYLRLGNKIYGLLISFLFRGPILTDAGSSFRIFKKKKLNEIIPRLKSDGPELQMELTTSLMINKAKIIETKVNYKKRKGKSNYTGNFYDSFKVLIVFTKVIILKFFRIF